MATPGIAAGAYARLANLTNPATSLVKAVSGEPDSATKGPSFGALLKDVAGAVAEAGRKSDTQAKAMAAGKSNIVDVVTAVSETEVAIDAVVSVRDKVIQAYDEIMRMTI